MAPVSDLNRVLYVFDFELNSFLRTPLVILVSRIYTFLPNFTGLLRYLLPGTIDFFCVLYMVVQLISIRMFTNYRDGFRVFCDAELFICRSMVWGKFILLVVLQM